MLQQKITLQYPWDENGYRPKVVFYPKLKSDGFGIRIEVQESEPRCRMTKHLQPVHLDSCVEWFVNFAPELTDRYFNFEVNANGCMNVAFRKDRECASLLKTEEIESLHIKTQKEKEFWSVEYEVPFTLIEAYIPGFERKEQYCIRTNFYKCGDETKYPHYGVWNPIDLKAPDFHRPEYFKELYLFNNSETT